VTDLLDHIDANTAALLYIDQYLAALPVDRNLISVSEHTDILLDLRNILDGCEE